MLSKACFWPKYDPHISHCGEIYTQMHIKLDINIYFSTLTQLSIFSMFNRGYCFYTGVFLFAWGTITDIVQIISLLHSSENEFAERIMMMLMQSLWDLLLLAVRQDYHIPRWIL